MLGTTIPYITFFPAVMFSAWFGGLGPGLVATALSLTAAFWLFISPSDGVSPANAGEFAGGALFAGVCVFINLLNQALRRQREKSEAGRLELLAEVQIRKGVEEELSLSKSQAERSRDLLQTTLASIRDAIVATNSVGTVTFLNSIAQELTGWQPGESVRTILAEVFGGRGSGENVASVTHLPVSTGSTIPVEYTAAPIRDESGRTLGSVLVFRDVTERRRTEQALRQSEERLSLALEAGMIGVWDWDIAMGTLDWSDRVYEIHGVRKGEFAVSVENFSALIYPEDQARVGQAIQDALNGERPYAVDFRLLHPNGDIRWVSTTGTIFRNSEGHPIRMLGAITDVTARMQSESDLRRQWRTFDTALSHSPDLTYTVDTQARFTYANRATLELLGKPLEEIVGRSILEAGYPAGFAQRLQEQIQNVVKTQTLVRGFGTVHTRQHEFVLVPVLAAEGTLEAIACYTRDVTDRIAAERREREQQKQMLQTARLESLGVLAGGIAHDFNNLLVGILGNATLLQESADIEALAAASEITLAAERAADLTKQMLAFSGKGHFIVETVDLNQFIHENLTLLRASLSRTVTVELRLERDGCFVNADRSQLQQVIMNLLINASDAVGDRPGKVLVRTSVTERATEVFSPQTQALVPVGRYVQLEVSDDGSGMSADTLSRIFDPFFTTKFTGRGLGLAAVLGIVRGHKGEIQVTSEPGAGTCFQILFPLSSRNEMEGRDSDSSHKNFVGKKVLVVDDEDIVIRLARNCLVSRGYHVAVASNGADALERLRTEPDIAVVILDLTMPVMTGSQAMPLIRQIRPDLPIILSSGFGEAELARQFDFANLAGVLQKPFTVRELLTKVGVALGPNPRS